jgi:hypothetical protein
MTTVVLYPKGLSLPKVVEALILGGEFQPTTYEFIEDTTGTINTILVWDAKEYPTAPSGLRMAVDFSSWDLDAENRELASRVQKYLEDLAKKPDI